MIWLLLLGILALILFFALDRGTVRNLAFLIGMLLLIVVVLVWIAAR